MAWMLDKLFKVEKQILNLIQEDGWKYFLFRNSLVRVSKEWEDCNIQIHKILKNLPLHNHPWPLAVRILKGQYEHMGLTVKPGDYYEILDSTIEHDVKIADPVYSLSINGPPFPGLEVRNKYFRGNRIKPVEGIFEVVKKYYSPLDNDEIV